jgi:hypothetical protein
MSERVGKRLDGRAVADAVAGKVQCGVQLVEGHLAMEMEQRDAGLPQVVPGEELGVGREGRQRRAIRAGRTAPTAPRQLRPEGLMDLLGLLEKRPAAPNETSGLAVGRAELFDDTAAVEVGHGAIGMAEARVKAEAVVRVVLKPLRRLR